MHAEVFDDVLKVIILIASLSATIFGARNHKKLKGIDEAVNGNPDPQGKTLRENVQELHDVNPDVPSKGESAA